MLDIFLFWDPTNPEKEGTAALIRRGGSIAIFTAVHLYNCQVAAALKIIIVRIGGYPRGRSSIDHKVWGYPSNIPILSK